MTSKIVDMNHSVGAKGQVVIPKLMRDALTIKPGQQMLFELRGNEIVTRKSGSVPLKGRFAGSGLVEALAQERWEERERDARRT